MKIWRKRIGHLMNEWINNEAVCRTAPATPGLLLIYMYFILFFLLQRINNNNNKNFIQKLFSWKLHVHLAEKAKTLKFQLTSVITIIYLFGEGEYGWFGGIFWARQTCCLSRRYYGQLAPHMFIDCPPGSCYQISEGYSLASGIWTKKFYITYTFISNKI